MRLIFVFAFSMLMALQPKAGLSQEIFVGVDKRDFTLAKGFLLRINQHDAMTSLGIQLSPVVAGEVPDLPGISSYMKENGFTFLLVRQVSGVLPQTDGGDFAYTALMSEPKAFASYEQQRKISNSVFGDIVEAEIGQVGLIAVSSWPTASSVLVSPELYADSLDLSGQKVVANSPGAANIVRELGATPIYMPLGDVAQGIEKGSIDAFVTSTDTARENLPSWQEGSILTGVERPQGYLLAEVEAWVGANEATRNAIRVAAEAVARSDDDASSEKEKYLSEYFSANSRMTATFQEFVYGENYFSQIRASWQQRYGENGAGAVDLLEKLLKEISLGDENFDKGEKFPNVKIDPIAFITNRIDGGGGNPSVRFGARRDSEAGLSCGMISPVDPREGSFGQPYVGELVSVSGRDAKGAENCVDMLTSWLGEYGEVVIFIHGFNNTFDDAIRRAIAYKYDTSSDINIMVWSWPSIGDAGGYVYDARSVHFSSYELELFVDELIDAGLGGRVTLLAHSMGSMLALDFVEFFGRNSMELSDLFLVAPDVPFEIFEAFKMRYRSAVSEVHLYANGSDRALVLSSAINRERPLGLGGPGRYIAEDVEVIDVTGLAGSKIPWRTNHSHAFDIPKVARDMANAIKLREPASSRGLIEYSLDGGKYYVFEN